MVSHCPQHPRGLPRFAQHIRPVPRWTDTYEEAREFAHADLLDFSDDELRDDQQTTHLAIALSGCRAHWWLHERNERIRREIVRRGGRP